MLVEPHPHIIFLPGDGVHRASIRSLAALRILKSSRTTVPVQGPGRGCGLSQRTQHICDSARPEGKAPDTQAGSLSIIQKMPQFQAFLVTVTSYVPRDDFSLHNFPSGRCISLPSWDQYFGLPATQA